MSIIPLEHRAGRVIAASRTFLALFFLGGTLIDPPEANGHAALITWLLIGYLGFAAFVASATWNRWWLEYRLSLPSHIVDLVLFALLVVLTGGYMSPFFGFSSFLIIAAATRWRTRQAMITSAVVLLVFLGSAWFGSPIAPGAPVDLLRFLSRGAAMVVLAAMILWFWFNQFRSATAMSGSQLLDAIVTADPPAREALLFAADCLMASRALLIWTEQDEPWANILTWSGGEVETTRVGPEQFADPFEHLPVATPFLFDMSARRLLYQEDGEEVPMRARDPLPPDFASRFGISAGLAIPMRTSRHEALLIAQGIPGLCSDFLAPAGVVSRHVGAAFERAALLGSIQDAAKAQSRLSLARNLHDGAVQFLAGMALKVRSVKNDLEDRAEVQRQLEGIEAELVRQQREVRAIIGHLRQPPRRAARVDLVRRLEPIAGRIAARWGIAIDRDCPADPGRAKSIMVSPSYAYHVEQMIQEAASNAVRHGGARRLRLAASGEGGAFRLEIEDDGTGFPFAGLRSDAELWQGKLGPLSLHQRVRSLGGSLDILSLRTGSTLTFSIPFEEGKA